MATNTSQNRSAEYERPKFRAVSESELFAGYGQQSYGAGEAQGGTGFYPYYNYLYYGYGSGCWPAPTSQAGDEDCGSRTPLYTLSDEDDWYSLAVELPGADPAEIDVFVGINDVVVTTDPGEEEEGSKNRPTRFYGYLVLPQDIDPEGTETRFANGVLNIKLAKVKPATRKHVRVSNGPETPRPKKRK